MPSGLCEPQGRSFDGFDAPISREQAKALLDACMDEEFPEPVGYWAVEDESTGRWHICGGDGDGVAVVSGSLFCGSAEAIARLFVAAADLARTICDGPDRAPSLQDTQEGKEK